MNPISSSKSRQGMWWAAILLAVAGLGFAIELTLVHVRLEADPSHQSICNLNASVNCDEVAKSSYAILLGLPVSVWGIFGYVAALVTSVWGLRSRRLAATAALGLIGAACALAAVTYAAISAFVLRTLCLFCMATWGVDIGLFCVAIALAKTGLSDGQGPKALLSELVAWLQENTSRAVAWAAVGGLALGMTYRALLHPGDGGLSSTARAASPLPVPVASTQLAEGIDEAGQPYVGARQPKLVVTEFSDYQCPHCARAHQRLRQLVTKYPEAVRVVHRHFPLDNDCNPRIPRPFHTHACYYARLAVCAVALGKFWRGNDYLFAHGRDESSVAIEAFARELSIPADVLKDCLATKADTLLKRDIDAGAKWDIDGTPTFIVGGEKFTGDLPADVWRNYPL
jgi:protein-disulfide isomerase/uncharacterized membrane protein